MNITPDEWIERNEDDPDDPYAEQETPEIEYAYDDLERTEATTDYLDHNFPVPVLAETAARQTYDTSGEARESTIVADCAKAETDSCGGGTMFPEWSEDKHVIKVPSAEEQQAYWESNVFLVQHNGEQPHED